VPVIAEAGSSLGLRAAGAGALAAYPSYSGPVEGSRDWAIENPKKGMDWKVLNKQAGRDPAAVSQEDIVNSLGKDSIGRPDFVEANKQNLLRQASMDKPEMSLEDRALKHALQSYNTSDRPEDKEALKELILESLKYDNAGGRNPASESKYNIDLHGKEMTDEQVAQADESRERLYDRKYELKGINTEDPEYIKMRDKLKFSKVGPDMLNLHQRERKKGLGVLDEILRQHP
jgi:hypothetical protein